MYYLHSPNKSGAYSAPQSMQFDGAIALNDDQLPTFLAFKGFGTVAGGVFTGNQTLLDAWNSAHPDTSETTPTPTETEQLRADVDYLSVMTGVTL